MNKKDDGYKELYDYLKQGLQVEKVPLKILGQIKSLRLKGFKCDEIMYMIYYVTNFKGKKISKDSIGIIEYHYTEAMEHRKVCLKVRETESKIRSKTKTVTKERGEYVFNKQKAIDIENLT